MNKLKTSLGLFLGLALYCGLGWLLNTGRLDALLGLGLAVYLAIAYIGAAVLVIAWLAWLFTARQ